VQIKCEENALKGVHSSLIRGTGVFFSGRLACTIKTFYYVNLCIFIVKNLILINFFTVKVPGMRSLGEFLVQKTKEN
jgi:hypothetical protein